MTPAQLIYKLLDLPSELMHKEVWLEGDGYLECVKDRKHGAVLSALGDPAKLEKKRTFP